VLVHTIGHGTASQQLMLQQLGAAGVRSLVDVRTAPGSRKHPHVSRAELERWLPEAGVSYRWEPRLGGFRRPPPDSPDVFWQNQSFRGYAAHLRGAEARAAIGDLLVEAEGQVVAVMCSETLWWRCHRRLIADVLVAVHGCEVVHLMPGRNAVHRPTTGGRRVGEVLVYDLAAN
jgi:uncharacterized protein (DUF488 family)